MFAALATKATDRVVTGLKQAQDTALQTVSQVSGLVAGVIPDIAPVRIVGAKVPTPKHVVETGFGIAERVLGAQKAYTLTILEAVEPLTAKIAPNGGVKKVARKPKTTA